MALYEKRVPFRKQVVSLPSSEQYQPWFLTLNPRGEVPVLTDGVKIIPDSNRIIEYLEDNFSNGEFANLLPRDKRSEESLNIQKFRDLIELLPIAGLLYGTALYPDLAKNHKAPFTKELLGRMANHAKSRSAFLRVQANAVPEFRDALLAKAAESDTGDGRLNRSRPEVEELLVWMEKIIQQVEDQLASNDIGKRWLCGEHISIADIDLAILLNYLNALGYEERYWTGGKRPFISAYWQRMQQRESFKKATRFSTNAVRLSMFCECLKRHRKFFMSLATVTGVVALSLILYRRLHQ